MSEDNNPGAAAFAEQLAKLRNDYLAHLPAELAELVALAKALPVGESGRERLEVLHQRLHKLTGSGGTFGLAKLSARSRSLEQRIKGWLGSPLDAFNAQMRQDLIAGLADLDETLSDQQPAADLLPAAKAPVLPHAGKSIEVWLVEDDPLLGKELMRQLESFNYLVSLFNCISDAETAAQTQYPDLLIMDVIFEADGENSTEVLPLRPNLRRLQCPLLFISSDDDFASRVRAAQLGAEGYFLKPLDIPRLVSAMERVLEKRRAPPQRVLIVDDDVELATHYRLVLMAAGMQAEMLSQPALIIEKVSALRPELVLMDLHMPDFSGPDLASVIRQHESWASLPIVYLSAETDLDLQIQAMNRGADDFLTKPVSDPQLVAAVRARIERARQLEAQITRDSLTGLLKHASIKEAAKIEVTRARRIDKPATLAMLDLDHFKRINDQYGHAVGDVVISSVATLLRQRLRQSDIVGRYGGEEFVVVLPECDIRDAELLLDDIRQRFSALHFSHEGVDFSCTLSAGMATTTQCQACNGEELLVAADEALYAAKRDGRNRVSVATPEQFPAILRESLNIPGGHDT